MLFKSEFSADAQLPEVSGLGNVRGKSAQAFAP